jgi:photosystem II stability/assembly factor-like uncharacterized protein
MRKLFLIITTIIFTSSAFSQTGWVQQNSGTTFPFNDVKMLTSDNVIICSYCPDCFGRIYRTTNAGQSWGIVYATQNPLVGLNSVSFSNSTTGVSVGGELFNNGSLIIKTTNGGANWNQQTDPVTTSLNDVHLLGSGTGLAAGNLGVILKTTDAGSSWVTLNSNVSVALHAVWLIDANIAVAVGASGTVIRTTNGGVSWNTLFTGGGAKINDVTFINASMGFMAADSGIIMRSTNAGANWTALASGTGQSLNSISIVSQTAAFVVGTNGTILKTTNNGTNWLSQNSTTANILYGVSFFDTAIGTAVGNIGTILRTTNGGVTFTNPVSNEVPDIFNLFQNYPNPFNPFTKIKFDIAVAGYVKIIIYNVLGDEIASLVNQQLQPGGYEIVWNASSYPSGIYFYSLKTLSFNETKKMLLIK